MNQICAEKKIPVKDLLKRVVISPLNSVGINVRKVIALRHLPKYLADLRKFKRAGGRVSHYYPILEDFAEQAGNAIGHYFHQDLLVASYVFEANPMRHIDIGSRIDGFVAHVASFRQIQIMDVRELKEMEHKNIEFIRADLMVDDATHYEIADSISCLHAIEHFGLGRYGDSLNPDGHIIGFRNIVKMLKADGSLYISFPIGAFTRVHFNAHRVFHPKDVLTWSKQDNLKLIRFDFVDDHGNLHKDFPLMDRNPTVTFGCGIYTFRKHKDGNEQPIRKTE